MIWELPGLMEISKINYGLSGCHGERTDSRKIDDRFIGEPADERFGCKTGRYIDRGPFGIKNSETVFCGIEKYESKFLLCKARFFYVGKSNWTNGCIKILKRFYIKHTQKRVL